MSRSAARAQSDDDGKQYTACKFGSGLASLRFGFRKHGRLVPKPSFQKPIKQIHAWNQEQIPETELLGFFGICFNVCAGLLPTQLHMQPVIPFYDLAVLSHDRIKLQKPAPNFARI